MFEQAPAPPALPPLPSALGAAQTRTSARSRQAPRRLQEAAMLQVAVVVKTVCCAQALWLHDINQCMIMCRACQSCQGG
jgi:hypothetical protein